MFRERVQDPEMRDGGKSGHETRATPHVLYPQALTNLHPSPFNPLIVHFMSNFNLP